MNIISSDCGGHIRLLVEGRVDTNTSPRLQKEILTAFQKNNHLVLDLLNVDYLSSAGLRALLIGQKTAASKGGSMRLVNVRDTVKSVLDMSGFSAILQVSCYGAV